MKTVISILFIFISIIVFSEDVKPVDKVINFRITKWGMSKKEVIQSEKIKLTIVKDNVYKDDSLQGELKIDIYDMKIEYIFVDDKLCAGGYSTSNKYSNGEDLYNIYFLIKNIIVDKYGKPETEDDNKEDWNQQKSIALSLGKIEFISKWRFNDVGIILTLDGKKSSPNVNIGYVNFELLKRKFEKQNEINSKNF